MAEMSMNKVIHAAVRRDLDRFVAALEAFRPGDATRAAQLHAAWVNFDDQLTYHHEGEHRIAWPALESVGLDASVLAEFDSEHDAMSDALRETGTAMDALARTPQAEQAAAALAATRNLRTVTLAHLDHEEAETEPVYLGKRDTPQIKAMGREFGRVSPPRAGRFFAWLLDGATPDERATVTAEIPGPVVTIIGGVFGRGYRRSIASVWRS
jgi:hypothetical protein